LDPIVSWESSAQSKDVDFTYGVKAAARPTTDLASLPRSLWGKASGRVAGWAVSTRAEVDGQDFTTADVDMNAENVGADVALHMLASAGTQALKLRSVEVSKGFISNGSRIIVTPRLNLDDDTRDVVVNYNRADTNVKVTASTEAQEVTISQQIDVCNRVAPTFNSNGGMSFEWERRLSDDSSVTANLDPKNSLNVEWRDSAWTANVNMPIDGTKINGANVSIKRDLNF
jgi:hypothetical protein